jgi:hypothetical protein
MPYLHGIRIWFMRKLRAGYIRVMLTTVRCYRLLSKNIEIEINKTIVRPVVLYECETWSLTLREEHGLRVMLSDVG